MWDKSHISEMTNTKVIALDPNIMSKLRNSSNGL